MKGCFGGCLGRIAALVLLAVLIVAAWRWGPELGERFGLWGTPPDEVEASPELAAEAAERYDRLTRGELSEITLSGAEIESLVRFRLLEFLPSGVSNPSVRFRDGEATLGLDVALDRIPSLPELESVRSLLPEVVPVQLRGRILTLEGGEAALLVHRIDASGIPIPRRFFPAILESLDPGDRARLPPEAVPIPLPPGVRNLRIEQDRLVVTRVS